MRRGHPTALLVGLGLVTAACAAGTGADVATAPAFAPAVPTTNDTATTDDTAPDDSSPPESADGTLPDWSVYDRAEWRVQPGPEQVAILGAEPDTEIGLAFSPDEVEMVGTVDDQGALLFRDVRPGNWRLVDTAAATASEEFAVLSLGDVPPASFYAGQELPAGGFGYLETRDGTTLSINVILPGPADAGPYPTVVEYSGYQPSDPGSGGIQQMFTALGYAYVGVNMRGTGCSGGSFEFFEPVQSLDGYDAVEAVAAQPWVLDHKVGMVGISYPGISQLYVAATRPPSLAAITPLSVLEDSTAGVLYPGGILNTGFAVNWTQGRMDESRPEGQAWAANRIAMGDQQCADNQLLRLQNPDLVGMIRDNPYWVDELAAPLAPRLFVDQIEVPVYLAGSWQDEQTGGRFANMLDRFTGTDHLYVDLVNGMHIESLSAGVLTRYVEFLDLYVAKRVPQLDAARAVSPVLASAIFGTDQVTLPPDRFAGANYDDALAWFEGEQPIRVLFEEGAADGELGGTPMPRYIEAFTEWPIAGTEARSWYLGPESLAPEAPTDVAGTSSYEADPTALPDMFHDEATGSAWAYDVTWDWRQPPAGTAASFVSAPFDAETVFVGPGSADLWIRATAPDTDLEVTVSEIRPDGLEVYIQSGWLRASHRALDTALSTELRPVPTHLEADAAPLPADEWTPVRVEIFPFAHAFRPGSRLRVTVDAPGNARAAWAFETIAAGETVEIAWGPDHPSRIVLPVVPGIDVPDTFPACTLRGQPCREYSG